MDKIKEKEKEKETIDPARHEQKDVDYDAIWSGLSETKQARLLEQCFSKLFGVPKPEERTWGEEPSKRWMMQTPCTPEPGELGHLCEICRHVDFQYLVDCPLGQTFEHFELFPLKWALLREKDCAFCRLVARTVRGAIGERQIVTEIQGKDVMCDFRMLPKAINPVGRAEMILLLVPQPESMNDINHLILSEYHAEKDVMARMTNHGISVESPRVDCELIKRWCHRCVSGQCGSNPPVVQDRDLPQGFRLIDVSQQCVVAYEQGFQYVTLSYIWGGVAKLRNTKALCKDFALRGALFHEEHKLPKTIKDAMALVEMLGERYLWVDSLCIFQDDVHDTAIQISAMDQIYSSSVLTIAAASGDNANAGLPGMSAGPRTFQRHIENVQGLYFVNLPLRFDPAINKSVWNSRAWTLQEKVSPPRVLYLGAQRCFFTCQHSQVSFLESDDTIENGLERPKRSGNLSDGNTNLIPTSHIVNIIAYRRVVEAYTSRHLTYSSDILLAFKALEVRLHPLFRSDFLFGIPRSELDSQLLWQPGGPLKRRHDRRTNLPIFPTWSWAGWVGQANCNDNENLSRIKWIDADGTRFSASDFRFPVGANADVYRRLGYRSQWIGALQSGVPYYMEQNRTEQYFFHPTAPEEERVLGPNLKAGTDHLVFAAETTSALKVEFGHYWAMILYNCCDDAEKDEHFVCPLVIRDKDDFVAGYVLVPAELSMKMKEEDDEGRYELIRISRTKHSKQTERGEEDPDLLVDEEAVTMEKSSSPDRPDVEKSKHFCACDQRRFDVGKPWCLYNVMLVEWEAQVAYRMGLGTVHIYAWAQANPREKIITLG